MTTYIFMLSPETANTLNGPVLSALKAEFPEHAFQVGRTDHTEFHNSIIPLIGTASTDADKPGHIVEPDKIEVAMVRNAFANLLKELRDWKPLGTL
jgi:hypothetical protein